MKTNSIVKKLASLARSCSHLAADGEQRHPEHGRDEWSRGRASGYLAAARRVKERMQEDTILVDVTAEEMAKMKAAAIQFGRTPSEILSAFVADFTGSLRTNGSDERFEHGKDCGEEVTEEESEEFQRLHSEASQARAEQRAEWQKKIDAEKETKQ